MYCRLPTSTYTYYEVLQIRTQFLRGLIRTKFLRGWSRTQFLRGWIRTRFLRGWIRTRFLRGWIRTRFLRGWIWTRFLRGWIWTRFLSDWIWSKMVRIHNTDQQESKIRKRTIFPNPFHCCCSICKKRTVVFRSDVIRGPIWKTGSTYSAFNVLSNGQQFSLVFLQSCVHLWSYLLQLGIFCGRSSKESPWVGKRGSWRKHEKLSRRWGKI